MNVTCPNCHTPNVAGARFCQHCRATMAATSVQGKTVVLAGPSQPLSPADQATIVQQVHQTYGQMSLIPPGGDATLVMLDQHEDTVVVPDISGSMSEDYDGGLCKLDAAKRASSSLVLNKAQIDPDDRIAVVAFDDKSYRILSLSAIRSSKPQILSAIQSLQIQGGTDINAGLKAARDTFDWSKGDVVRRIILLTDGHGGHPLRTAEDLKDRGVVIDVIGVGDSPSNVNEKLLRKVASVIQGETRYRFIKDQQTLVAHYTQLANKTATGA